MSAWFVATVSLAIMTIFLWAAYSVPIRVSKRFFFREQTDRADVEDNFRKTFAQVLGGAALIATFSYTIFKDSETLDQAKRQFSLQQFIEAAKLLKEDGIGTRAAGVYALEQVAAIRSEFRDPILNTLLSFIRSRKVPDAAYDEQYRLRPAAILADTQAAIVVLARRDIGGNFETVDLNHIYLTGTAFTIDDSKTMRGFERGNFAGATLYGVDMHKLDLTDGAFSGSRMADWEAYGSSWNKTIPRSLDYKNERYKFTANFNESILKRARFDYVYMGGVSFWRADLENVHFFKNDLSRANFIEAKHLAKTTFDESTMPAACFGGVVADGITISNSTANGADFGGASLRRANFANTDFTEANFRSAILSNADFRGPKTKIGGADFTGADLSKAMFDAPDFSQAILKGTNFREAILRGANFSNAVLSNVSFDGADLVGANFDGACADGIVSFGKTQPRNLPRCTIANSESPKTACVIYGYRD